MRVDAQKKVAPVTEPQINQGNQQKAINKPTSPLE
jgi:hypothetical protein